MEVVKSWLAPRLLSAIQLFLGRDPTPARDPAPQLLPVIQLLLDMFVEVVRVQEEEVEEMEL